jgi:acetyl esterase/lipase
MADDKQGLMMEARILPFPRSVSIEAQAALKRLVGPDGIPLNALHVMPPVDDHLAWMSVKAAADQHYAAAVKALSGSLQSSVETIQIGDTTVHVATPASDFDTRGACIDLHGGAFVVGGGEACRVGAQMQADRLGIRCYGVDYRMPPEHPYPAALDDCMAAYGYVLGRHAPQDIVVGGRSAGGNLAAATILRARDEGLPSPAAVVLLSPELDLTESGDSFQVNQMADVVLPRPLMLNNLLYANGHDLSHPYLSPLFGSLDTFPPTFLQSGTRDLFLSNAVRMHRSLRRAGVAVEIHIFEAMPHGGFMGGTPEDAELAQEVARFVKDHLGGNPS